MSTMHPYPDEHELMDAMMEGEGFDYAWSAEKGREIWYLDERGKRKAGYR